MDKQQIEVKLYDRQVKAVDAMIKGFDEGRDTIILEGPTGSGKSLLAAELSKRLACRVFVTTPLVSLVNQMYDDPKFHKLAGDVEFITGRSRWTCHRDGLLTVAKAVCKQIDSHGDVVKDPETGKAISCEFKRWDHFGMPACAYYNRKAMAEMADVVVTTLSYFLRGTAPVIPPSPSVANIGWNHGRLSGRDLLIVDEAHGLTEAAASYLTTGWDQKSYTASSSYHDSFSDWLAAKEVFRYAENNHTVDNKDDVLLDVLVGLEDVLRAYQIRLDDFEGLTAQKELDSLERDLETIKQVKANLAAGVPWVGRFEENGSRSRFEVQPVVVGSYLRKALWNKATRVVLQSATWTDVKGTVSDAGLEGRSIRFIRVPSSFPPENAPIYLLPIVNLSKETLQSGFPKVADALFRIMAKEPGRGLVHTATFVNASWLQQLAPSKVRDRMWVHQPKENREDLLKRFMYDSPPGTVLVSPSMIEGVDLQGDMGEWAAILKASWPYMGDRRIARRMKMSDGQRWFEQQVVEDTIQALGRVVRGDTERAHRYVLDGTLVNLLRRWWYRLPPWFKDACLVGDSKAPYMTRELVLAQGQPAAT